MVFGISLIVVTGRVRLRECPAKEISKVEVKSEEDKENVLSSLYLPEVPLLFVVVA